jgi:transcriptional regulator with PAS, ATPase and Fis domain
MDHLLEKYRRLHDKRISGFTERAVAALLDYDYPGNIRELENMIESAVILSDDDAPLDASLLFASTPGAGRPSLRVDPEGRLMPLSGLEQLAKSIVDSGTPVEPLFSAVCEHALRSADGNFTHAAERVGLTRAQLAYRVKSARRR